MSKPKSKKSKPKQTAAPKARTHIKVMVVHAKTREVLEGAEVTVTSVTPEEEKPQHGKTEKDKGYRTKKPVRPGDKTIIVKIDGFGPVVTTPSSSTAPAPLPTVGPVTQTVTIGASDGAEKIVTIEVAQVLPRATFQIGDENYKTLAPFWGIIVTNKKKGTPITVPIPIPLIGAKIFLSLMVVPPPPAAPPKPVAASAGTQETGKTGIEGEFATSVLQLGTYSVTVRKTGFKDHVDSVTLDSPDDFLVHINLENLWGRVRSHDVKVGTVNFVDWFNKTWRPTQTDLPNLNKIEAAGFNTVFDSFSPSAWDDPLTLEEFVAIVLVMVIETGGTFKSVAEKFNPPELQYFFEPNAKSGKGSYNAGGNRKAGENLVARQVLKLPRDKALRDAWNRPSPYPGVSAAVTEADIRECDFYKYRGHGLIQVTWHNNYDTPQFVAALATQGFTGLDACPTATMDRLLATTPAVYLALVYGWLFGRSKAFRAVNKRDWEALHTAVNAHSSHYHSYAEHCEAMIEAMIAAGPLLDPAMAPYAPGQTKPATPGCQDARTYELDSQPAAEMLLVRCSSRSPCRLWSASLPRPAQGTPQHRGHNRARRLRRIGEAVRCPRAQEAARPGLRVTHGDALPGRARRQAHYLVAAGPPRREPGQLRTRGPVSYRPRRGGHPVSRIVRPDRASDAGDGRRRLAHRGVGCGLRLVQLRRIGARFSRHPSLGRADGPVPRDPGLVGSARHLRRDRPQEATTRRGRGNSGALRRRH